jgi:alkyl hydroperoxide reductase subunit AhpC
MFLCFMMIVLKKKHRIIELYTYNLDFILLETDKNFTHYARLHKIQKKPKIKSVDFRFPAMYVHVIE